MPMFEDKSDDEIETWIRNFERKGATNHERYGELLEERARRAQTRHGLKIETSLERLKAAAIEGRCVSYGELAAANGVSWAIARHQMNGAHGHLDRVTEVCWVRKLPLLTAICVNRDNVVRAELEPTALSGFSAAARRVGIAVADEREFHHACVEACWAWGRDRRAEGARAGVAAHRHPL